MKTNVTLAMILWVLVSACGTTVDVPALQTLPEGIALAGETDTAIPPTETIPAVLLTLTARPTATVTRTPTPIPTPTPLPALPADAADLHWITAYGLPGDQFATAIHPARDGGFLLVGGGRLLKLRADGLIEWQTYLPQVNGFTGDIEILEFGSGTSFWQAACTG